MNRRKFVASSAAMVAAAAGPTAAWASSSAEVTDDDAILSIRRLTWAGVRFEYKGTALFVDPITTDIWDGDRDFPIVEMEPGERRSYVLLTHLHNDHYDKKAIREVLGDRGRVVCHSAAALDVVSDGFPVRSAEFHEPVRLGGFHVLAVPAVDGFGTRSGQVSWILQVAGKTFIHCGDTLWHGHWWDLADAYGPFDVAYMPINGVHIPGYKPQSLMPASMTPEQAVAASVVLGAKLITPIHFGHNDPDFYQEYPAAVPTLLNTAKERDMPVEFLEVGEVAKLEPNR